MNGVKGYILSIIVTAVISAIIRKLLGEKGTASTIGKLLTGLVMTFTVLSPLKDFDITGMNDWMDTYAYDAQQAIDTGIEIADNALRKDIKAKTEAYILDKARPYGADIAVTIGLTDESIPKPESVTICGNISPYAKNILQNMIQSDLGINKEHQTWT